jgi:hypothetical protein
LRACRVGRHQLQGETGAAADGQPATAQGAIDKATESWVLFGEFHSFGEVQRLRDDTFHKSTSPWKPVQRSAAYNIIAAFISGALRELSVALCRGNASLCRSGAYVATRAAGRAPMRGLAQSSAEVV